MATQAEKARIAEIAKSDREARMWAYVSIGIFLPASLAANVMTAWEFDTASKIVAGFPPLSLFVASMMYERMRTNKPTKVGMALTVLVSLGFSWYHIAHLAMDHHQPIIIAWLLPVIIDVPMLFAGQILLSQRKSLTPPSIPTTTTNQTSTTSTPKVTKSPRTRTSTASTPKTTSTPRTAKPSVPALTS